MITYEVIFTVMLVPCATITSSESAAPRVFEADGIAYNFFALCMGMGSLAGSILLVYWCCSLPFRCWEQERASYTDESHTHQDEVHQVATRKIFLQRDGE